MNIGWAGHVLAQRLTGAAVDIELQSGSAVRLRQILDSLPCVVCPVAVLSRGVRPDPVAPARFAVAPHDVGVQVEPVAVLESNVPLVDGLDAWTTTEDYCRAKQHHRRCRERAMADPAVLHFGRNG